MSSGYNPSSNMAFLLGNLAMNGRTAVDDEQHPAQPAGAMDLEKAKFIFQNTESYLRATIETSEALDRKTFNLLSLIFSAALALLGFLLINLESGFASDPYSVALLITNVLLLVSLVAISFWLLSGYFPHKAHYPGNYPENLLEPEYLSQELAGMMVGESINHRKRIDENMKLNQWQAGLLRKSRLATMASLLLTPVVFMLLYWVFAHIL